MTSLSSILDYVEELYRDTRFGVVRAWKDAEPGRKVVGHLPVFAPREVIDAAGALPLAIAGAGDRIDVVRGDACFQSYICRIPRSSLELALDGSLDFVDLIVFPTTCDVIRNLSGVWALEVPHQPVYLMDLAQDRDGADFQALGLRKLWARVAALSGVTMDDDRLREAIRRRNAWRAGVRALYDARAEQPWNFPLAETALVVAAGDMLPPEAHMELMADYVRLARERGNKKKDQVRVVIQGAFCERPPLGLLRTLDRSGIYVVDDDLVLYSRWYEHDVPTTGDPIAALGRAFVEDSVTTSTVYEKGAAREEALIERVRRRKAEGVVLVGASFCDPALLDRPAMVAALGRAGIPCTDFKFAENTGQFKSIREQVGTFSDSVRLWSDT